MLKWIARCYGLLSTQLRIIGNILSPDTDFIAPPPTPLQFGSRIFHSHPTYKSVRSQQQKHSHILQHIAKEKESHTYIVITLLSSL